MADYTLSARITGDASSFTRAFENAQQSLDRLAEKTKEIGSKVSDLGKKLSTTVTPALTGLGAGAMAVAAEFESSTAKIQNSLGVTEEEAKKLSNVAKDIYNRGFGESLPDIEQALIQVRHNMKNLSDSELSDVIVKAQTLGNTFDTDVNEVTRAGNNIMTAFGISSEKAFDLMAHGAQNGLNFSNELFDNLSEYGPLFGKMGFSAEEYFQLLIQGSKAGVYNLDYINDVMKEFQIRIKDGSKTTSDAMAQLSSSTQNVWKDFLAGKSTVKDVSNAVLAELKNMDDQVLANQIGVSLFGTKWEDLEAEAMYALGGINGELGNFEGTMDKMIEAQEKTFGQQFQSMLRNVKTAIIPVGNVLNDLASTVLPKISSAAQMASEGFSSLSSKTQKIIVIVGLLLAGLGPLLVALGSAISFMGVIGSGLAALVSPIGLIIAALAALGVAIGVFIAKNETLREKVLSVFSSIGEKVTNVIETIKGIIQAILPIFQTLFNSVVDGFQSMGVGSGSILQIGSLLLGLNPIVKGVILLFQNFGPQIVGAVQQVVSMLIPVVSALGNALGEIAASIIPVLTSAFQTLTPVIIQVGTAIMNIVQMGLPIFISLLNQLIPIVSEVISMIAETVAQLMPLVSTLISSLLPVIVNLISTMMNITQTILPAVIAIIQVIMQVIQALLPIILSIITVVVEVVSSIISVITPIVAFIGGIINAIMAIIVPIVTFIAGIIASIISVITPIIDVVTGIFNTVFSIVSGVFRNIVTFIGSAINGISTVISGISSTVSSVFNTIFSTVSSIMNRVSSTVTGVFNAIRGAWSGLTGFVGNVFSGISSSVQTLVNQVKGFINNVIGGINSAIGLINKIPGVSIGKIPYLARGTDNWMGGFAYINEGGRGELVNLPNGAQVIPHDVSMRYAREAAKEHHQSSEGVFIQQNDNRQVVDLLRQLLNKNQVIVLDTGAVVGGTYNEYDRYGGNKTVLAGRWE